jgi:hypothetical protein
MAFLVELSQRERYDLYLHYEEEMPVDVYGEEADYLIDIGDTSHPAFQCPKCHKDTLYRKRYYSELTRHN